MQRRSSFLVDQASGCPFRVRHLDDVIENDTSQLSRKINERELRYEHLHGNDFKTVDSLLRGGIDLSNLPCQEPKVVRMFVCSSGQDFEAERNYLFENVYPLVRQHCTMSHGIDFQLVDLGWGDSDMPSRDPHKMTIPYQELHHCQTVSMGPNFVVFVGQKYGETHVPVEVVSGEMDKVKASLKTLGTDSSLLDTWYTLDHTCSPPVYRLNHNDNEVNGDFDEVRDELVTLLQTGSANARNTDAIKCANSDLENLVQKGLLEQTREVRDKSCIVYIRDIKNIDDHLNARNAGTFVDLEPGTSKWSTEKKNKINVLRTFVEKSVRSENMLKTEIELNGSSLDEEKSGKYITDIGRHFFSTVTKMIQKLMSERNELCRDPLINELALHWGSVGSFTGPYIPKEEVLDAIKSYLLTETEQPLVFYGGSGSGKSSLIAKAASDINEAIANKNVSMPTALVVRFVGETGSSEDIQPFLFNLCHQLAFITRRYRQEIPHDYPSLKNYFIDLVQRGEYGGMLVILIDALDRISSVDNGHRIEWLPSRLAGNVKIVVTVSTDNKNMLQRLENKIPSGLTCMPAYTPPQCEDIVKMLLTENGHKNTVIYEEWKRIKQAVASVSSPLFSKLVFEQTVSKWRPYKDIHGTPIERSVEEHAGNILANLEKRHGDNIVQRILGYVTAVKGGLSESELDDIMALDEELLNEVFVSNKEYPHIRRMPHLTWSKIREDMAPYLVQKKNEGISTITWKYQKFEKVATQRYLPADEQQTIDIYSNMADYFLGIWSGTKKKPFRHPAVLMAHYKLVEADDEHCRNVLDQPLCFSDTNKFNNRKLALLPYLLTRSERTDDLKEACFCNYDWLASKLKTTSVQQTISDFEMNEDRESALVADALRMSKSALKIDSNALGIELTGRLLPHINRYPFIKDLIRQCDLNAQRCCPLVPNCQIYSAPGGPLQYECDIGGGVKCPVDIGVFSSPDGILLTAKPSHSNRLRVWELSRGDERPDIMLPLGDIRPTRDGRFLNIFEGKKLKTYRSDCGVLHGEIEYSSGQIADVDVSKKYLGLVLLKGAGPFVFDLERSELLHKFTYHTHAVAISDQETYVAFNAERSILLYELPTMQRRCVATATDVAHDIIFINDTPKCLVMTKTKLIESIQFDVVNRKFKSKSILTDMEAKECIPSNSKELVIVRSSKTLHVIDTYLDQVITRFQKLPPGVFVDANSQFTGAGFTPDDRMIVAARYTYLIVWEIATNAPVRVLQSAVSPVMKMFTSDRTNKVVTLLENSSFQVWNIDNLDRDTDHTAEIHHGAVRKLAVSSATEYILTHDDKTPDAKLVCMANGKTVDTLQHSENSRDRIVSVMLSPDGLYAVTRAKVEDINSFESMTFEALCDDVMWEVETASKVFHAMSNRYIVFSPNSETAIFVTCAFYNRCDWTDNIYNVFVVHPETSSNYTIDFPYHTEFVCAPKIVCKSDVNYFVTVVQTCRKIFDQNTRKEVSRNNQVRLLIHKIDPSRDPSDEVILRVQNFTMDAGMNDEFLDLIPVKNNNVLALYAKDIPGYEFVSDKGLVPPKSVRKGALLIDVELQTALKHIPVFLESPSQIEGLLVSSQYSCIVDSDMRVFKYETGTFQYSIKACSFAAGSVRLALDGRYIVGIASDRRNIVVVRVADDKQLGSLFVHGRATCLEVSEDDRTVVVGTEDGRVMIMSLILEFADPLREFIEKMPSRCDDDFDDSLIVSDVRRLSLSTPDKHRLSARLRHKAISEERKPPSYTTLQRAVAISRLSNRERSDSACNQQ